MALPAATRLGPYEIQSAVGAGGMGEVYKARDTRLDRIVAIKVLSDALATDPGFRERFDREAKSVAALTHPHICALYDVGHQDGTAYLVMEYLEGNSLAGRLGKGALPLDLALRYAIEISGALRAAHGSGIVHRDLKPGNIMLTPSGAKLLDFGLAKATMPAGASGASMLTTPATLTAQGTLLGTLQYMAPEQLEGGEADARTDIFAFGAVVYEMLTGKKAFEAKSQATLIAAIIGGEPPSIVASQPVVPPSLDRVVKKCLAKDPRARWQTARDLHDELQWITESRSQPNGASQRPADRDNRWQWAIVAALVLVPFLGLAWWHARTPVDRAFMRFSSELRRDANGTLHLDDVEFTSSQPGSWLAVSPDATRLAMKAVRDVDGKSRLGIRRLDEAQFRTLAGTENATSPFFKPDSEWIAFFGDGKLRKIPVQGGAPREICNAGNFATGSWGDDGNIVASLNIDLNRGGLSRVSDEGGTPAPLTQLREGELGHRWPQVLPGSTAVLFTVYTGGGPEDASIDILSLKTHERKTLVRGGALGRDVTSSDGHAYLVYVHQNTLLAVAFDARTLSVAGTPQPILNDVASIIATSPADFDVSSNGTFVYVSGRGEPERSLFWLDETGKVEPSYPVPGFYNGMRFSPVGNRLVFAAGSVLGQGDLWIQDVQRNTPVRLTSLAGSSNSPVWSVDGKYIVFRVVNQPDAGIYVIRSDGSGGPHLLDKHDGRPAAFSPGRQAFGASAWRSLHRDGGADRAIRDHLGSPRARKARIITARKRFPHAGLFAGR
jgi:serine/threonine-protein kinase